MKTVVAGTIVGVIAGAVVWWVFFTDLSVRDLVELIFVVTACGIGGGVGAYRLWQAYFSL